MVSYIKILLNEDDKKDGIQIKQILKKEFNGKFNVRIQNFSTGRVIQIYTDLIVPENNRQDSENNRKISKLIKDKIDNYFEYAITYIRIHELQ
jgi:hypothetical protein